MGLAGFLRPDLLKDVLPVADTPETVRQHLHKVADRQDAELGTGQSNFRDDGRAADQPSPMARGAVLIRIDGGSLWNWHDKRKKFEVIVGKSRIAMIATLSAARMPPPSAGSARCCGACQRIRPGTAASLGVASLTVR